MTEPLNVDPKRQANASIRGYRYQILRSVHEWLELSADEVLYVEGAEDIDRVSSGGVDTLQVKDTAQSGSLTLGSSLACESIQNFLQTKNRNPGRLLRFHLITTSKVGIELGSPFGQGRAGVAVWEAARSASDRDHACQLSEEISGFLLKDAKLDQKVLDFIRSASPEQLLSDLIRPLAWHADAPGGESVESAALRKLRTYCWERGIPSEYGRKVLARLEQDVWRAASTKGARALTLDDLRVAFDQETTVILRQTMVPDLSRRESALLAVGRALGSSESGLPLAILGHADRTGKPPPALGNVLRRTSVEQQLATAIATTGCVHIYGATGTGKTTLAAIVASLRPDEWLWVSCRNADEIQVDIALTSAGRWMDASVDRCRMVIDDVDYEKHLAVLERHIPGMLFTVRGRGGALVFTAHREMPQRLRLTLNVGNSTNQTIPYFTEGEIAEYLSSNGCADESLRASWAGIIRLRTRGHPQLVAAEIMALANDGFPKPRYQDFLEKSNEAREAQDDARLLLANRLPVPQRDLLYRLSLLVGPFKRSWAVALGAIHPEIAAAGDAFDRLTGPWIERADVDEFTVSPLIHGSGSNANGGQWTKQTHAAIADIWVSIKDQTPWTIAAILFHAVVGDNGNAVVRAFSGLSNASDAVWESLATADTVFSLVYSEKGKTFVGWNPFQVFCARYIQLQFASRRRPELCVSLYERIDEEFPPASGEVHLRLIRKALLGQLALRPSIPLPLTKVVAALVEVASLSEAAAEAGEILGGAIEDEGKKVLSKFDPAETIAVALVQRTKSVEDLALIVNLFDSMEPELRARALRLFDDMPDMARQLCDSVWLTEHEAPTPRWLELSEGLDVLARSALKWKQLNFAQGIASVRARVLAEDLSNPEAAVSVLEEFSSETADGSYMLDDARAKILLDKEDYSNALLVWERVFPKWEADLRRNDVGLALAMRRAGICATKSRSWESGAYFFERGARFASESTSRNLAVGLLADAGFAYWKSGIRSKAFDLFCAALVRLEPIANTADDVRSYFLHKVIGHVLTWVSREDGHKPSTFDEPLVGCCSHTEINKEVAELNPTPIDFSWANLFSCLPYDLLSAPIEQRLSGLRSSSFPGVRMRMALAEIERILAAGQPSELVSRLISLREAISTLQRQEEAGGKIWEALPIDEAALRIPERDDLARLTLCRGLLVSINDQRRWTDVSTQWKKVAGESKAADLSDWLARMDAIVSESENELIANLGAGEHWTERILRSSALLNERRMSPRGLLYGQISLLLGRERQEVQALEREVCFATVVAWRAAVRNRSALKSPDLTVPAILDACENGAPSWKKIAQISVAASPAVSLRIPTEILGQVRRIADS